jgi:hypothetical protein
MYKMYVGESPESVLPSGAYIVEGKSILSCRRLGRLTSIQTLSTRHTTQSSRRVDVPGLLDTTLSHGSMQEGRRLGINSVIVRGRKRAEDMK